MGNEQHNRQHYTVRCGTCSTYGRSKNTIYSGYSRSDYNYYRNSSTMCGSCCDDKSRENRERAERQAQQKRDAEELRIKKEKERLERLQRERLEREREEMERKRRKEKEELLALKQREEAERIRKMKEIMQKKQDEINAEAQRIKQLNKERKEARESKQFKQFKSLDTVNTVKKICDRVKTCSVVGQVITEQVTEIADTLKNALKDEYDTIKPEIKRYKKYGVQMKNMTNAFIDEFDKVFIKQSIDIDGLNEEMKEDPDISDCYMEEMKTNFSALLTAINTMETKLFLMEQYYDQIILDYENFIDLCGSRKLATSGIPDYLTTLAMDIKGKKRDVFEGIDAEYFKNTDQDLLKKHNLNDKNLDEFKQKLEFSAQYKSYQAVEKKTDVTDWDKTARGAAVGAAVGAGVGIVAGGIIGGLAGGPGGAVAGIILGGIVGAVAGGIIGAAVTHEKKEEYEVENIETMQTLSVYLEKVTYDGTKQAKALEKIIIALKEPLKQYANNLEKEQISANKELIKMERLKGQVVKMSGSLKGYKTELKGLMAMKITTNQATLMSEKWDKMKGEIQATINKMK